MLLERSESSLESDNSKSSSSSSSSTCSSEPRIRRALSTSSAQTVVSALAKEQRNRDDQPVHKHRDSLFSWSSGFHRFEGVINWAFLLLCIGGTRLFLENLNKYGIRVNPRFWLHAVFGNLLTDEEVSDYPTLYLLLYTNVFILLTLAAEKLVAQKVISAHMALFFHLGNLTSALVMPVVVVRGHYDLVGPLNAVVTAMTYSVLFLKMWSYIHVNTWCRNAHNALQKDSSLKYRRRVRTPTGSKLPSNELNGGSSELDSLLSTQLGTMVEYPYNLTVADMYYFVVAPTLCYELNFPRSQRIRKTYLMRRLLEVIIGVHVMMGCIQQWIFPAVINSLIPFSNMEFSKAMERLLKLALPNHFIWLVGFYLLFHSFLNTSAELLRFADRQFYLDWWNSTNLLIFWKTWNLPVHRWCVRHLFKPLLRQGFSASWAQLIVFAVSAFFHEYIVSGPLGVVKAYAFLGMMAQFPLIFVSAWIERRVGSRAGNLLMWLSLIIGQPLALMMYYHDFVVEHHGRELLHIYGRI